MTTTSPGMRPGLCSLIRSKATRVSSAIPGSTSATTVAASSLQRSSDGVATSWLMSMCPIRRCTVFVSSGQLGPQPAHFELARAAAARQPRQTTRRVTCTLTVSPE